MYEAFKPLGLLSITIGWASLFFLMVTWGRDKTRSVSKHASAHRAAYLTMAVAESIFLPMYLVFLATWFTYTFKMPVLFVVLSSISVAGLLIAAWVPDVADVRGKIHTIVTRPAYICMILSMLLIMLSPHVNMVARWCSYGAFLYMLVGAYLLNHEKGKSNYFYLQMMFLASVHLSVLAATYIR